MNQISQQFKKNVLQRQTCHNPRHQGANDEVHGVQEAALQGGGW